MFNPRSPSFANSLRLGLASSVLITFAVLQGCSSSVQINQVTVVAVTGKEKPTAAMVAAYAKSTPPSSATSMGMLTSPKAGTTTIPITNVEVFVFHANVDGTGGDETMYWAATEDAIYVWGQIGLTCVDDGGNDTGETGTADFVYEADAQGAGWMTATDACGYSTYFGCSSDGGGEVCGGCDFNQSFIACVAASS